MTWMNKFLTVAPRSRRRLWQIRGYVNDRWVGTWACDSEEIAELVGKRLRKGQSPRWAARDIRQSSERTKP